MIIKCKEKKKIFTRDILCKSRIYCCYITVVPASISFINLHLLSLRYVPWPGEFRCYATCAESLLLDGNFFITCGAWPFYLHSKILMPKGHFLFYVSVWYGVLTFQHTVMKQIWMLFHTVWLAVQSRELQQRSAATTMNELRFDRDFLGKKLAVSLLVNVTWPVWCHTIFTLHLSCKRDALSFFSASLLLHKNPHFVLVFLRQLTFIIMHIEFKFRRNKNETYLTCSYIMVSLQVLHFICLERSQEE